MKKWSPRTDLALESALIAEQQNGGKVEGITLKEEEKEETKVTTVEITEGAERITGRKAGHYVTIESADLRKSDSSRHAAISRVVAEEIRLFVQGAGLSQNASCLIAGLGNELITPDSLGPRVTDRLIVTNHLFKLHPEHVQNGYRPVSAISPGVMGMTGIETGDILLGLIEREKPDFLIVIDALASRSIERLNATIQMTDAGIQPGAGIGNRRKEISRHTAGIPVIAIGIPTVIDAVTVTRDAIEMVMKHLQEKSGREDDSWKRSFLGNIGLLDENEKHQLINDVLTPAGLNMIVTPKEADLFIHGAAAIISSALNEALHDRPPEETRSFFAG
ncbi:GPR endopeptidase [Domibacillus sp. A3M-37]|uniref:GPR endopeptidase n=1 Tax=Domibacillus TaxID=1433999 RepID=UPI000617FDA0|nr:MULTISPECIES: GPR endopeptidase [Domibacillus]MCP3764291.1 GPR endopeptidase [Domibacillus sp. A3M-37]